MSSDHIARARHYSMHASPESVDLTIPRGPRGVKRVPCSKCERGDHSSHGPTCCPEIVGEYPRDMVCSCKEGIAAPSTGTKSDTLTTRHKAKQRAR